MKNTSLTTAFESAINSALLHRHNHTGSHLGCTVLVNGHPTITKSNSPEYHAEINAWLICRSKAISDYCGEKGYKGKGSSAY